MFETNGHFPRYFGKWSLVIKSFLQMVLLGFDWKWVLKGRKTEDRSRKNH
jgi:hypothetical protein